jgi:ribonuclease Z
MKLGLLALTTAAALAVSSLAHSAPASEPVLGSSPAAARSAAAEDVIKLTFLGTGAPRPSPERKGASILVEAGGRRILIDCGPGIRERIFQAGNFDLLTGISDIFVTHLHYDHIANIPDIWIAGWMYGRNTPLRIHGPEGTSDFVGHIRQAYRWDIRYREIVGIPSAGNRIDVSDIRPGVVFDEGGLKVTAFEVAHMPIDPKTGGVGDLDGQTLGFRVDYRGRSVVFSGDVRALPDSEIIRYGRGADVVVLEVQVPSPGNSPEATRANVSLNVHTSPEQAGHVFSETRPRMAVYSHIVPPQTTGQELSVLTRPYYQGPLTTAFDLMTLTIGEHIEVGRQEPMDALSFESTNAVK